MKEPSLPLQNGHLVGRVTSSANPESGMLLSPFLNAGNPEDARAIQAAHRSSVVLATVKSGTQSRSA
jgi:hypothetical protein